MFFPDSVPAILSEFHGKVKKYSGYITQGWCDTDIPCHSGIVTDIVLYGDSYAYIPTIGLGVQAVKLGDIIGKIPGRPAKYVMFSPVGAEVFYGKTQPSDSRVLITENSGNLTVLGADLTEKTELSEAGVTRMAAAENFPLTWKTENNQTVPDKTADLIFAGGRDGVFRILRMENGTPSVSASLNLQGGPVRGVRFDKTTRLVFVSTLNRISVIDADNLGENITLNPERVLGTVKGPGLQAEISGASDMAIGDGVGYTAVLGTGKVYGFLLGCPGKRSIYTEDQYPVPQGSQATLKTDPEMKVTWEIIGTSPDTFNRNWVRLDPATGVLSVSKDAEEGHVRVRAKNKDIAGCDLEATVKVCSCGCQNCDGEARYSRYQPRSGNLRARPSGRRAADLRGARECRSRGSRESAEAHHVRQGCEGDLQYRHDQ